MLSYSNMKDSFSSIDFKQTPNIYEIFIFPPFCFQSGRKIEGSKLKKNNIYVVKEEKLQVTGRWIWEGNKVVNFELEEGDNVEVNGGGSKWQGKKINQFNARDGKLMVWFFFFSKWGEG